VIENGRRGPRRKRMNRKSDWIPKVNRINRKRDWRAKINRK
jgi:hypothetical protein